MARFFALGFLLLPLAEIAMFIVVGRAIGLLPTLALVILAAIAGMLLLRRQGLDVVSRLRSNVNAGTIPGRTMFDTMMIGLAGLLLVVPGFLSDIAALILLLPPVRASIFSALAGRVRVVETTTTYRSHGDPSGSQDHNPKYIDLNDNDRDKDRS
ncbi:FxsA family protein [Devosia sp. YIM 151766]|uniref:FxsA family protein n=1 Tax=Devosia sp. YIM 151766 TaxID=3017325 RepID=UPI00255C9595|nr:FxsA family protein [Devosia sp. YIM 151766]WIY52834.1 FxsA family protein [Devosia sp. YIM 151766]